MSVKPKKPITVNPQICRPIAEDEEGNREICFVEGCDRDMYWHAAPPPEEVVRQAELSEKPNATLAEKQGHLVLMCSRCVLYKSVIFKGRHVQLRKFIKDVEARMRHEGKLSKPFERKDNKLEEEEVCRRILGTIVTTSIAFLRRNDMLKRAEQGV